MAVSIPLYTVDDLDRFPDDGNRYELLDGVLIVTPAPNQRHQIISARLIARLVSGIGSDKLARVVGPGVIPRLPRTQLEPDVLVYPARFPGNSPWTVVTEHWLAVEIFSPSSKIYDREFKRGAYLTPWACKRCGWWMRMSARSKCLAQTVPSGRIAIGSSGRFLEPIEMS